MRLEAVLRERERERESKNLSLFNKKGVPIGNLTSQLFANVYMNEFDQFIKHELKVKYYARYTDDFIIISKNIKYLENLIGQINVFLNKKLKLNLHPEKVFIIKYIRGVDFLGYIIFPHHKLIRNKTWKRILRNLKDKISMHKNGLISKESLDQTLQSYLGVLSHGNNYKLGEHLKNQYWFWLNE